MAYDEYGNEMGMDMISSDGASGFELYAGLGLNVVQTEGFQLGGEVLPGLIAWGGLPKVLIMMFSIPFIIQN